MKKKELKVLVEDLTEKLRVVTMEPDSPEAKVITLQMMFAEQVHNAMDTGEPIDTPMLLGVFGKMMYPAQLKKAKERPWPLPDTIEGLKHLLGKFFKWIHATGTDLSRHPHTEHYVNKFMMHLADEREN
jgi:hypothetical protein